MKFNVIKFLKAQLSVALATLLVTNEFFKEKIGRLLAVAFMFWSSCVATRPSKLNSANVYFSLERRWSSRTFRYGYLVTTSPQSLVSPSTASSLTGWTTGFGRPQLPWCDGRCVQDPGTHSPRHSDSRLLATPTSCGRVSAHNPNWDRLFRIRSRLLFRCPLYRPL